MMRSASRQVVRIVARMLAVAVVAILGAAIGGAEVPADDPLTFVGSRHDLDMNGARGIAVTSDGRFVYVAARESDVIVVFSRDLASHELTLVGVTRETEPFWLDGVFAVAVSPDGGSLYATGGAGLAVYQRNPTTGLLTFLEGHEHDYVLTNGRSVLVSPDDKQVYVGAESAVSVYTRDRTTGRLARLETEWSAPGLSGPVGVGVNRNGCVAVAGALDDRFATLRRSLPSEPPVPLAVINGVSTVSVRAVAMASTRGDMYVAGHDSDAVASFKPRAGCRTYPSWVYADSDPGIDGLRGIQHLALSPDERHLYTAAEIDDAVVVFSRDPGTGQLTQVGLHRDGVDGVDELATADGLAVSHDGFQVFVSGFGDDSLATFTRTSLVILVDGFESGDTAGWSAAAP